MKASATAVKETTLNTDLNALYQNLIRELATACRKVGVYGIGHPQSAKAVEKPFLVLSQVFKFKVAINLNVQRGLLYVGNIGLKETVFSQQLVQQFQMQDARAVVFHRNMRIDEFGHFVHSLVDREVVYSEESLGYHVSAKGITSVEVDSERAILSFEETRQYRGDVDADFSAKRMVLDQLGSDLVRLSTISQAAPEKLFDMGIDFDPALVEYLLPEKIAEFTVDGLRAALTSEVTQLNQQEVDGSARTQAVDRYMGLIRLIRSHPDHERILANMDEPEKKHDDEFDPRTATGKIKLETTQLAQNLMNRIASPEDDSFEAQEFCARFLRLLRTGQQPRAVKLLGKLVDSLEEHRSTVRQRALEALLVIIAAVSRTSERIICESLVGEISRRLDRKQETFEYSELIARLFRKCHQMKFYDLMANLVEAMSVRRAITSSVTIFDSMAVKKGFEAIANMTTVNELIDELIESDSRDTAELRRILIGLGNEEVALGLSKVISHPHRPIRQTALKVLSELGKSSLKVFSRLLCDDRAFEREEGRQELPSAKWYVIRNSIFVLGSLKDPEGVEAIRVRLNDPDVRVRREIISALEKINCDEAIDCLLVMAEDPIREIRKAAIIATGIIGHEQTVPLLIDLAQRQPSESVEVAKALGHIGGEEAVKFLGKLLIDPTALTELVDGKVSRDDLRLAVIKALGRIGDECAISHVKSYNDSLSGTSKILFRSSAEKKIISDLLHH